MEESVGDAEVEFIVVLADVSLQTEMDRGTSADHHGNDLVSPKLRLPPVWMFCADQGVQYTAI